MSVLQENEFKRVPNADNTPIKSYRKFGEEARQLFPEEDLDIIAGKAMVKAQEAIRKGQFDEALGFQEIARGLGS